jgi:hypothetical protein
VTQSAGKGVQWLTLPVPDRTEIEALGQQSGDPRLTSNQQSIAQQKLRVAEVLYEDGMPLG